MTYILVRPDSPLVNMNNTDGKIIFKYKSPLRADMGQSFGRMFLSFWDNATPQKPVQFGDWLHINDMFTDSLFKNVRIQDYANNVEIQSSTQSHLQSIAFDLLQPDANNIAGITSNSNLTITSNATNNVLEVNTTLSAVGFAGAFDHIQSPLDLSIGHNFDDLNQHSYARWGETLEPFPLPTRGITTNVAEGNNLIMSMKNKAGLTRLKRQFLFGNVAENFEVPVVNSIPYIYKPNWCDMFDGRKSYWTDNIDIELVRGNILNSVQYQSNVGNNRFNTTLPPNWLLGSSARGGVQIKFDSFEFIFYVTAQPTRLPARQIIWTTDIRTHVIDSPYFNKKNLILGNYDFCLLSFVKNKSYNRLAESTNTELCPYRSGLSLKLLNKAINGAAPLNATDEPTLPLLDMTFYVDHGDSITQIPSNERYRVFDYTRDGNNNITSTRVDLILPYIEYLKACGLNPFDLVNHRAKLDYNSFVSQMLYVPVSMRKDRQYWSTEPQAVTVLGVELNFNAEKFLANSTADPPIIYNLNIVGFKKIML